jgi:hypothetical protein
MEIFKRDKAIQDLLYLLDIPMLPYITDHEQGIGPYDPDYFGKYYARRKNNELDATDALNAMKDEDLLELCEAPGRLSSFSFEHNLIDPPPWYAGGFGVCVHKADFDYWAKMEFWTINEAACLRLGFKPEKMPSKPKQYSPPSDVVNFFWDRMSLIQRAPFNENSEQDAVQPRKFVSWAEGKSIEMPAELIDAVNSNVTIQSPKMINTVDKRQYDSALKVILGLLSSQFGYRSGEITADIKSDIKLGLAELGLNLNRKTLIKILADSISARVGFEKDQKKRDDKDI